jgi:putative component of membrane protein insertase Oxa1/YidC/SpoIIIJ protein YidD
LSSVDADSTGTSLPHVLNCSAVSGSDCRPPACSTYEVDIDADHELCEELEVVADRIGRRPGELRGLLF